MKKREDRAEVRSGVVRRRRWTAEEKGRVVAPGAWLPSRRAPARHTLIATATLNHFDPLGWLDDVLARLPDHPRFDEIFQINVNGAEAAGSAVPG
jgi:IS66 C-terminal element